MKDSISKFSQELTQIMPHLIRGLLRNQGDAVASGKITVPQYTLLSDIISKGSLKMKDIARDLGVSLPAATGIVSRLHGIGLLRRVFDPNDRRIIYIVVTPKGKKIVTQVATQRKKAIGLVFGKLTQRERDEYLKILRKVMKVLYPDKK